MFLVRPLIKLAAMFVPDEHDWLLDWASDLLATIPPMVRRLNSPRFAHMSGDEKAATVVAEVRRLLDASDDIPGWRDFPEVRRDRIIQGVSELALFVIEVTGERRWDPGATVVEEKKKLRATRGRIVTAETGVGRALRRLDSLHGRNE